MGGAAGSNSADSTSLPYDSDFDLIPNVVDDDDDNDGFTDEYEIALGTDPLDSDSYPTEESSEKSASWDLPVIGALAAVFIALFLVTYLGVRRMLKS